MSYEECELAILRSFVAETETINKKVHPESVDIQLLVQFIENVSKQYQCICYDK